MIKNISKKLVEQGFKSNKIGRCELTDQAIIEALWEAFSDEIQANMIIAEEEKQDEQRAKPKTRAEWHEYTGIEND